MAIRRFLERFSIWHAALLLPWVIASYGFARTFNDNSYLWHVRAGDWQLESGRVLNADPFSFTMQGEPWRTQSWLAELLYSPLDAALGLDAAPIVTTVCAAITLSLLGIVAYRRSQSLVSVSVYLVATSIVMAGFLNPRPVIFSFPLFAAVVVADDDRRLRWSLPLLMWVWTSVHGSFFIGLAYLGIRAIQRRLTARRLGELLLIGAPVFLTAHGLGVLEMLSDFMQNRGAVQLMAEWRPPQLLTLPFFPIFLAFLALIWLGQSGRLNGRDWVLLVPFLVLLVSAARSVPPAWIGLAPILGRVRLPLTRASRGSPLALVVGLACIAFPFVAVVARDEPVSTSRFPIEAAEHLETKRVFHDDATGGWLIYRFWPERLVYVDDRAELFGERMEKFLDIQDALTPWKEEFAEWGIEEALLRADAPLERILLAEGWHESYRDEDFVVLRADGN